MTEKMYPHQEIPTSNRSLYMIPPSRLSSNKPPPSYPFLYYQEEGKVHELFPFDPNTADSTTFKRLGLEVVGKSEASTDTERKEEPSPVRPTLPAFMASPREPSKPCSPSSE